MNKTATNLACLVDLQWIEVGGQDQNKHRQKLMFYDERQVIKYYFGQIERY